MGRVDGVDAAVRESVRLARELYAVDQHHTRRDQQRLVYDAIDKDFSESVEVEEMVDWLEKDPRAAAARQANESLLRSQEDRNIGEITLPPRLREVKDRIADEVYKRTRATKTEEGNLRQDEYLINGLRSWDVQNRSKGDGTLSPREIVDALGPKYLNLGVSDAEVRELVDYLDLGEQVPYKQFVKKLEIGDHAPDFNPFFDARDRELVSLKRTIAAPWQWEATDELLAKSKELQGYSTSPIKKRAQTASPTYGRRRRTLGPEVDRYVRPLCTSRSLERHHEIMSRDRAENSTAVAKEALTPCDDSEGVFDDMRRTRTQQMAGICPRFVPQEPTDWTRTGLGGDGMSPKSGVYLDPTQRFGTTTNRYYTPIIYEPNKPCRRENVSDSTRDFRKRQALKAARKARGRYHRDRYAENRLFEEQTRIHTSVLTSSPRRRLLDGATPHAIAATPAPSTQAS